MEVQKASRETKFHHALISVVVMAILMFVCIVAFGSDPQIPLVLGCTVAGVIALVIGYSWDLMAGEYDLTFYNTAGGSFDPATDMSNMAPGAMGDPILCQFSAFFENPEIFAELDSTSDSQRVQEIYGMILNGIADQNLLVPVTGTHDLALWNTDKITGYDFYTDASYVDIASVHVK